MHAFKDSQYHDSVVKTKEFMFNDLKATISLAQSRGAAPNFLLALGLCCYTEFWGRLVEGIPSGNEEICFDAFFNKLGKCYRSQRLSSNFQPYRDIRNGLVHAYLDRDVIIKLSPGKCGIVGDPQKGKMRYIFHIKTYSKDFQIAVNSYINRLHSSGKAVEKMERAFKGKVVLT